MVWDYDVIVIGLGVVGLFVVVVVVEVGVLVFVVESEKCVGGLLCLLGGYFYVVGIFVQKEVGVMGDMVDVMFEYYMMFNQFFVDFVFVCCYCEFLVFIFEWFKVLGVNFFKEGVYCFGVGLVLRGYQFEGDGEEVINVFEGYCSIKGVELVFDVCVIGFVINDDGWIIGICIGVDEVMCGVVVMVIGGFGVNFEMIEVYYFQVVVIGDWCWYIGVDGVCGDGIEFGKFVGGVIDGQDCGLLLVILGFSYDFEVMLFSWLILVNVEGRWFCDEIVNYMVMVGLLEKQGGWVYVVFDEFVWVVVKFNFLFQVYWVVDVLL